MLCCYVHVVCMLYDCHWLHLVMVESAYAISTADCLCMVYGICVLSVFGVYLFIVFSTASMLFGILPLFRVSDNC